MNFPEREGDLRGELLQIAGVEIGLKRLYVSGHV